MQRLMNTARRIALSALARRNEFVVGVLTFAPDHAMLAVIGFAALLGGWFVLCAVIENRHYLRGVRRRILAEWRFSLLSQAWA